MAKAIGSVLIELSATTQKLQAGFQEANNHLKSFQQSLTTLKHVVEGAFAFKAAEFAIDKIREMASEFAHLAVEGAKAKGIEEGFAKLGGTASVMDKAAKAAMGLVDASDLMQIENKGLLAQGPGFNRYFADITALATRQARVLGMDSKTAIEDLTHALIMGSTKGLKPYGFDLSETKSAAERTLQALGQLKEKIAEAPPVVIGAGFAFKQLQVEVAQLWEEFGKGIDDSQAMKEMFDNLKKAIHEVDWRTFGKNAGDALGEIGKAAEALLPIIVKLAQALSWITGVSAKLIEVGAKIAPYIVGLKSVAGDIGDMVAKAIEGKEPVHGLGQNFDFLGVAMGAVSDKMEEGKSKLRAYTEEQANAAKSTEKLREELAKLTSSNEADVIRQNFTDALKVGNLSAANDYLTQYNDAITKVAEEATKKYRAVSESGAEAAKQTMIDKAINPLVNQVIDKNVEIAKKAAEDYKKAFGELLNGMGDFLGGMNQLFSGVKQAFGVDMPEGLRKALDIANGLLNIIQSISTIAKSLQQISQATSILQAGNSAGSALGAGANVAGAGAAAQGGSAAGGSSSGLSALFAEMMPYAALAAVAYVSVSSWYNNDGGARLVHGKGKQQDYVDAYLDSNVVTGWVNPMLGMVGMDSVGGMTQKLWGGHNADMNTRRGFQDWWKEQTGKEMDIGGSGAFDPGGKGWEKFNSASKETQGMVSGIGEAIAAVTGIASKLAPQIGALILNDVGGNANKARAEIQGMGISAEQMKQAVIKSMMAAGKSFLEIQNALMGIDKAFEPGIEGAANFAGAMKEIQEAGAGDITMLQGLSDLAQEAMEAHAKSMADMKSQLAKVMDPKDLEIMFKAFAAYGIDSVDKLKNATLETKIAIAAMMQALGFSFKQISDAVGDTAGEIKKLNDAANGAKTIPEAAAEATPQTPKAVSGKAMRKVNASASAHAVIVNVDARHAAAGVEHQIRMAIEEATPAILDAALNASSRDRITNSERY